jgi:hypothetical protein
MLTASAAVALSLILLGAFWTILEWNEFSKLDIVECGYGTMTPKIVRIPPHGKIS